MLAPGYNISQKKVLIIAPQPFFVQRGTPINVRAMAASLANLGYAVDLLIFPLGQDINIPGVTIHRSLGFPGIKSVPIGPSWRKIVLDLFLFLKASTLMLRTRYSAVQGIEEGGFMAWLLGSMARIPSIFDMDSCMVTQLQTSGFVRSGFLLGLLSSFEMFCIRRSSAVITVCQALTDKVKEFAPNARIHQIEDFPLEDLDKIAPLLVEKLCGELKIGTKLVALYTGNFEAYQGIDLLIESFAMIQPQLNQQSGAVVLILVGGDDEKIKFYKAKALELGVANHIIFTGPRPSEEMGAFMSVADVLVSPRLHGSNTPLKLYSYMAMTKTIVATDIESHSQVLTTDTAFLAAPRPEAFSKALLAALDNSEQARSDAQSRAVRAKELVELRYSKACFVRRLSALYTELVGPAASGTIRDK